MIDSKKKQLLLNEPNLYKTFIILSMPVFFANLLTSVHDIVDAYFLGQIEDSVYSQAAISLTWPLLDIFMTFSMGLAIAGVSVISQNLGAGLNEEARHYEGLLFSGAIAVGSAIGITVFTVSPFILHLMGAEGEVFRCSLIYLRVRSLEVPFILIFNAFQAIRQAHGDTVTPFYISASTIILNIVMTGYFVKVLEMGIFGAAFATFLAHVLLTPVIFFMLFRKKAESRLTRDVLKFDKERFSLLFRIGLPSAVGNSVSSFGFLVLNSMILSYGEVVVAAFSIGNKFSSLLLMPMGAISTVQATYIGQNLGAGNELRIRKGYKTGRNLALMLSITGAVCLLPLRQEAASIMSNNAEVVEVATEYMVFVFILQPMMGLFQNFMGVFNGSGRTRCSMVMSLSRLWVIRIPLILIFKNFTNLGRVGIWCSMVLSNFLILFVGLYMYRHIKFTSVIKK